MSAPTEHLGHLQPRRLVASFVLCVLVLALTRAAAAQCPPALVRPPIYRVDGIIDLRWVHPQYFCDTLRAHTGPYAKPFFVTETSSDNRVAIKLPAVAGSTATMLHAITAYFIGKSGVSQYEWSIKAAFTWTLCADSDRVPGSPLYPSVTSPIGENDSLLHGRWFEQPVNWWLPDSTSGGVWLVGGWPSPARAVVRLGSDASNSPLPLQLGYNDGTGMRWEAASDPGLLIEMEILHSQSVTNDTLSSAAGFLVVRELLSGAMSPRSDTAILQQGDPFIWNDSLSVVGQTLRYRVVPPCTTDIPAWTSDFTVPAHWSVRLSPETLAVQSAAADDTTLTLWVQNQGSESLLVQFSPGLLTNTVLALPAEAGWLFPNPDSLTLTPGEARSISLSVPLNELSTGAYVAWLVARIEDGEGLQVERRAVLIRLDVDLPTAVNDGDSDQQDSPPAGGPDLTVSAGPNPFEDRVVLAFETRGSLRRPPGRGSSVTSECGNGSESVEVTVYNSLGHKVKHQSTPIPAALGTDGEKTVIVIEGTRHWPSGVYLVRVRHGNRTGSVKLLHLK